MQKPVVMKVEGSQIETFKGSSGGVCVCIGSPQRHEEFIAAFQGVATKYHSELTFGLVELDEKNEKSPLIECQSAPEAKQRAYSEDGSGIEAFVLEATRPVITDLTPYNHKRLLDVSEVPMATKAEVKSICCILT